MITIFISSALAIVRLTFTIAIQSLSKWFHDSICVFCQNLCLNWQNLVVNWWIIIRAFLEGHHDWLINNWQASESVDSACYCSLIKSQTRDATLNPLAWLLSNFSSDPLLSMTSQPRNWHNQACLYNEGVIIVILYTTIICINHKH